MEQETGRQLSPEQLAEQKLYNAIRKFQRGDINQEEFNECYSEIYPHTTIEIRERNRELVKRVREFELYHLTHVIQEFSKEQLEEANRVPAIPGLTIVELVKNGHRT